MMSAIGQTFIPIPILFINTSRSVTLQFLNLEDFMNINLLEI